MRCYSETDVERLYIFCIFVYNDSGKIVTFLGRRWRLKGEITLKKRTFLFITLSLLLALFPAAALADDTGALSEGELSAWVDQVLTDTIGLTPLNAPVGEEALTEDGYAFLYDFATLYYDQPELNENSVLQAVVITDEGYTAPRGIRLGGDGMSLMSTFGWQNPYLYGDGAYAAFYCVDELPRAAYWSWAQHDENDQLLSVQCAVHVQTDENCYTDAGVRFLLEDGLVSDIRIYGLNRTITEADVLANLNAVASVENVSAGTIVPESMAVAGYTVANDQTVMAAEDVQASGLPFAELCADSLTAVLGEATASSRKPDETVGGWIVTTDWAGASLVDVEWEDDHRVESLSVTTDALTGPRGLRVGDTLQSVLSLFRTDGEGRTRDGLYAVLYGDGLNAPYALMEYSGSITAVSYTTAMEPPYAHVTLHLAFEADRLQEWMLYSW